MQLEIKKGFEPYKPSYIDEVVENPTIGENKFADLFRMYEKVLDEFRQEIEGCEGWETYWPRVLNDPGVNTVLSPEQINAFLQASVLYNGNWEYKHTIGYFMSKLIMNSYQAGYKEFEINIPAEIDYFPSRLDEKINLKISGTLGSQAFGDCKSITAVLEDAGGSFAGNARNCTFTIGTVSCVAGSMNNCTIKTRNKRDLQLALACYEPFEGWLSCTFLWLKSDGTEEEIEIVKYGDWRQQ